MGNRTDDGEAGALPRSDRRHQHAGIDHHSHSALTIAEPKAAFKSVSCRLKPVSLEEKLAGQCLSDAIPQNLFASARVTSSR